MKKSELKQIIREELQSLREDRKPEDYLYSEEKAKGQIVKVIAILKNNKAGSVTKLITNLTELDKEITELEDKKREVNENLQAQREQYNIKKEKLKDQFGDFFDAEDEVYTRILKTMSTTATLSKKSADQPATPAVPHGGQIDYEKAFEALAALVPQLSKKIAEIKYTYAEDIPAVEFKPGTSMLRFKTVEEGRKLNEDFLGIGSWLLKVKLSGKKLLSNIKSWTTGFDKKLDIISAYVNRDWDQVNKLRNENKINEFIKVSEKDVMRANTRGSDAQVAKMARSITNLDKALARGVAFGTSKYDSKLAVNLFRQRAIELGATDEQLKEFDNLIRRRKR